SSFWCRSIELLDEFFNIGVFRFEGECFLVGGLGLFDSALGFMEIAEIDNALGVVGLEVDGLLVGGEGVLGFFELNEGGAKIVEDQRVIGSDFMMPLDECPLGDAPKSSWATAVTRTTAWMSRALTRFDETEPAYGQPQYLLCIIQGGTDAGLRRQSAESLLQLEPSGVAIGGLAVGESKEELLATLEELVPQLPADTPRYLMGVGTPADLVRAVGLGVDMFDCVLPTRNARNGQLFTSAGKLNLRNAKFRHDLKPVQDDCGCPLCRRYTRAYLRHLFVTGEVLGLRLATAHNLWFYHHMMADMRSAISEGVYSQWARDFLVRYEEGSE
ncbi:MAG: tRNA-guanine transglycosylase, partial [Candidatus Marinimicrobia bacterium]|nr:tRNA-guanine transglycosylase [Candidatus Neomarinimicrobiota bacterium]